MEVPYAIPIPKLIVSRDIFLDDTTSLTTSRTGVE